MIPLFSKFPLTPPWERPSTFYVHRDSVCLTERQRAVGEQYSLLSVVDGYRRWLATLADKDSKMFEIAGRQDGAVVRKHKALKGDRNKQNIISQTPCK